MREFLICAGCETEMDPGQPNYRCPICGTPLQRSQVHEPEPEEDDEAEEE